MRDSRKLDDPSPAEPEDAGSGATRSLIGGGAGGAKIWGNPEIRLAGTAEGCEIRGNSKIHRRRSEKMRDARKLAASSER
jgi:hypothetical protein